MAIADLVGALNVNNIFQGIFLPFLLTFVIFWGILTALRIFNRTITLILALGITIAAGYGGLFGWLSQYLLVFGGYVGIIVFGAIFVIGVMVWGFRRGADIISPDRAPRKIRERIEQLYDKISKSHDEKKIRAMTEEIRRLEIEEKISLAKSRR